LLLISSRHATVRFTALVVQRRDHVGQPLLQPVELLGVARAPGRAEVHSLDEFDHDVAERLVQRARLRHVDVGDGEADLLEELELLGLALVGAVDAVRGDLQDGAVAGGRVQGERRVDRAADQRLDLVQLRRIPRPFAGDPAELLPRDVFRRRHRVGPRIIARERR
jgi:hypothetical protein